MSKNIGFNYQSLSISKHSDSYFKEQEEFFDYNKNEKRSIKRRSERTNVQKGSSRSVGFGIFLDTKPVPTEGKSCNEVVMKGESNSLVIGPRYGNHDVKPKKGYASSESDEEIEECPPNPERPGLKYKRTRRRRATYKEGDHVSQTSIGFGIRW